MVMPGRSVYLTTLFLGKLKHAVHQYFVHILSLVTDNNPSILLAPGDMPSSFFHHDKLHLNVHGTRRLLSGINNVIPVTNYTYCPYKLKPQQARHMENISRPTRKVRHMLQTFCRICSKSGHCTQERCLNGRNALRLDVNAW